MHSTNYYNTFIQVADDCLVTEGEAPPQRAEKSVANVHYDLLGGNPYRYTSDEVIFEAHRERNRISDDAVAAERERFFAKGQASFGRGRSRSDTGGVSIAMQKAR